MMAFLYKEIGKSQKFPRTYLHVRLLGERRDFSTCAVFFAVKCVVHYEINACVCIYIYNIYILVYSLI